MGNRKAEGSLQDSQPPALAAAGDRALEERQALVEDPEFPAEVVKSVGHPWRKAGDKSVRSARQLQGHRESRECFVPGTG